MNGISSNTPGFSPNAAGRLPLHFGEVSLRPVQKVRTIEAHGVGDFFRHWGGEALYNSHDRHAQNTPIIGRVGTPCIVEADVPIAFFKPGAALAFKIVRAFLISRGFVTPEPGEHEDKIIKPLPASAIRRVIRYPSPEFIELSGCENLRPPLQG